MIFETQNSKKFFEQNYSHELTIASVLYIIVSVFAECFGVFLTSFTSLFSIFCFYCWYKLVIFIQLFCFFKFFLFIFCSNQLFFYLCFKCHLALLFFKPFIVYLLFKSVIFLFVLLEPFGSPSFSTFCCLSDVQINYFAICAFSAICWLFTVYCDVQ